MKIECEIKNKNYVEVIYKDIKVEIYDNNFFIKSYNNNIEKIIYKGIIGNEKDSLYLATIMNKNQRDLLRVSKKNI